MLNNNDSPPPPAPPAHDQVMNDPQSSTHHQQPQNQGDNNLFAAPPLPFSPFNNNNNNPLDLPPFFSPVPTIAETFVLNANSSTPFEDELNPSYQYQYASDYWYNDLFTIPLFQDSYVFPPLPPPVDQSFENSNASAHPPLPPSLPPPPPPQLLPSIASNDDGEPSEPNSFPIIDVDAPSSIIESGAVEGTMVNVAPSSHHATTMTQNSDGPNSDQAMVVVENSVSSSSQYPSMAVDTPSSMIESGLLEAMMVNIAPSSHPPPTMTQNSDEPNSNQAMVVVENSLSSSSPSSHPSMAVDAPSSIIESGLLEDTMVNIAPSSHPPPPTTTESSDDSEAMVFANSSSSPSMDVSSIEAMLDAILSYSHAPAASNSDDDAMVFANSSSSSSHALFMADPLSYAPPTEEPVMISDNAVLSVDQPSRATKRKSEDFAHTFDSDLRHGVPIVSELDLLRRFLRLAGSKRDGLQPMIIKVKEQQDAMEIITTIAKEKRSLLIMGTVGTLSVAQFVQQGKLASFEGNFTIISLAGIIDFDGDMQSMSQIFVSIAGAGGKVFGGPVHGRLIAATPLQMFGLTLVRNGSFSPRRLKTELNLPKIQKVTTKKRGGEAEMEEKNAESEEANRSQVSITDELNEHITNGEEGSNIDEMLAEYIDAKLQRN